MLKKTLAITLAFVLAATMIAGKTHALDKDYKIKRLVSQLYERRTAMDAQRQLTTYGTRVTQYVLPLLKDKNNESIRVMALRIIESIDDKSAEPEVVASLKDRDHRVRQQAARTLSVIGSGDRSTVEPLKELLNDHYPNVRFNAIRALAAVAPKEDISIFINSLGDYDPRVRMFAVIALGRLKDPAALPYLAQMVRDYDPNVRAQVARSLARIGTENAVQPLVVMMGDPDPGIRILAVEEMANLDVPGTDGPLVKASDSSDPRIASRAILSLGEKKSSKALQVARDHLDDEHMSVKLASIQVLGRMGNDQDKPVLKGLLKAESTKVRKSAQLALQEVESRT